MEHPENNLKVTQLIVALLNHSHQLSANELVAEVESKISPNACKYILPTLAGLRHHPSLSDNQRNYLASLLEDKTLNNAVIGVEIKALIVNLLHRACQPSATELLKTVEDDISVEARWQIKEIIQLLSSNSFLTNANKDYLKSMLDDGSLEKALSGTTASPTRNTGIDILISQSNKYRQSSHFKEMIEFMGLFREYAPYNNMLIKVQNPSCGFYATAKDWRNRFGRTLKEDARPMLILAPMHPVMTVYDIDQTEGKDLPKEINQFSKFEGTFEEKWLGNTLENAKRHRIRIDFKKLGSINSGFATFSAQRGNMKMRIAIHDQLDDPSRFGVICHELAHIFLGHLGSDKDLWWPSRSNLSHKIVEIEAEAVAFIVTNHLGLVGSSASYVSRYLGENEKLPKNISIDTIAKVAGKIRNMALGLLSEPKEKPITKKQKRS